jgi:hypothetical protein
MKEFPCKDCLIIRQYKELCDNIQKDLSYSQISLTLNKNRCPDCGESIEIDNRDLIKIMCKNCKHEFMKFNSRSSIWERCYTNIYYDDSSSFIGYGAGHSISSGSNNCVIGYKAGYNQVK